MKKLKKFWYIPFAILAVLALVAASPTPRKILSETFSNWIMIEGGSPMIYHDTTTTSGGSVGMTYYRDNDDNVDFSAGVKYGDGDVEYYSLRVGEYNGPLGIYVNTDGDVGIGKEPAAGVELDVDGDIDVSGDAGIADDLTVKDWIIIDDGSEAAEPHRALTFLMYDYVNATDSSWHDLYLDGSSALPTMPDCSLWYFRIYVVLPTDVGEANVWEIEGIADRPPSGSGVILDSSITTVLEDDADWDVQVTMSSSQLQVQVRYTGGTGFSYPVAEVNITEAAAMHGPPP